MRGVAIRTCLVAAIAVVALSGCDPIGGSSTAPSGTAAQKTVPNVVGARLSGAESTLRAAGLSKIAPSDDTGRGRTVIDPENWVVDAQTPTAGTRTASTTTVTLRVRRPSDGATTSTSLGVVPDVVCMNLQDAQNTMQRSGFVNLGSADGAGQGRMQILDRDWVVITQSVRAGTKPGLTTRIVLTSVKYGEPTGPSGCKS